MRPIYKSKRTQVFKPYNTAKHDLESELGKSCSYCENGRESLDVEHIYAKGLEKYKHLETNWDNFLLACKNCNSTKGSKDISNINPFMPHEHNLLCFIEIKEGGIIEIKPHLSEEDHKRTEAFINLVGLDRHPEHSKKCSPKDRRWEQRRECYRLAQRSLEKYKLCTTDQENILQLAEGYGFFSVWFTVFKDHPEVRKALLFGMTIKEEERLIPFPSTHTDSFDTINNYEPVPRPAK
jgi:hypothetical protein